MTFTVRNHYVPQWYQKRFINSNQGSKLHYLDLNPEKVIHPDKTHHYRKALRNLSPKNCFKDDHLYTLHFGEIATDVIEKRFFGEVDHKGSTAVDLYSDYTLNNKTKAAFNDFLKFMDAQKLRTPKGLDFLKKIRGKRDHQQALILMGRVWQAHCTIWQEGVWEILCCDDTDTKFILTDHPVCTYNKGFFPGSKECRYPSDAPIECLGTHTIFPLGLTRCLVITNRGYVRNPKVNPKKVRENPRSFAATMFDLRKIQTGRQISEAYVQAINFVLKNRARKFIAAQEKDWLFPEQKLGKTFWGKLGGRQFLMPDPRKVNFTTATVAKFGDGGVFAKDEYGRVINDDDINIRKKRDREFDAFQAHKRQWDAEYGALDMDELQEYL